MHNFDDILRQRLLRRHDIHERALRAAMAVAFGAACSTPSGATGNSTAGADTTAGADATAATDTAAATETKTSADAVAATETKAAADAAAETAAAPDAVADAAPVADSMADAAPRADVAVYEVTVDDATGKPICTGAIGANFQPCCDQMAEWCKSKFKDQAAQQECLFGPNMDGSTGCVPWGPPAPPAMV